MGVDVKLMPLLYPNFWTSHDILRLQRRSELWPELEKLPQQQIPEPLGCYDARLPNGEICYGRITEDPYGCPLSFYDGSGAGHAEGSSSDQRQLDELCGLGIPRTHAAGLAHRHLLALRERYERHSDLRTAC